MSRDLVAYPFPALLGLYVNNLAMIGAMPSAHALATGRACSRAGFAASIVIASTDNRLDCAKLEDDLDPRQIAEKFCAHRHSSSRSTHFGSISPSLIPISTNDRGSLAISSSVKGGATGLAGSWRGAGSALPWVARRPIASALSRSSQALGMNGLCLAHSRAAASSHCGSRSAQSSASRTTRAAWATSSAVLRGG